MTGKLKIIILALALLLTISLLLIFSLQSSKSSLLREYSLTKESLTQENRQLFAKLDAVVFQVAGNNARSQGLLIIAYDF